MADAGEITGIKSVQKKLKTFKYFGKHERQHNYIQAKEIGVAK